MAKLYFQTTHAGLGIIYKTNFIWNIAFIPNTTFKMFKIVKLSPLYPYVIVLYVNVVNVFFK